MDLTSRLDGAASRPRPIALRSVLRHQAEGGFSPHIITPVIVKQSSASRRTQHDEKAAGFERHDFNFRKSRRLNPGKVVSHSLESELANFLPGQFLFGNFCLCLRV